MKLADEGYIDDEDYSVAMDQLRLSEGSTTMDQLSPEEREELIYKLIASLPRSQIARVQRRIAPLIQVDIIANLPDELALHVLSYLAWPMLLRCALVSRRWSQLAYDNVLWKDHCEQRGWEWYFSRDDIGLFRLLYPTEESEQYSSDEGLSEDYESDQDIVNGSQVQTLPYKDHRTYGLPATPRIKQRQRDHVANHLRRSHAPSSSEIESSKLHLANYHRLRYSAPSILKSLKTRKPDYRLLHQTHILMRNRLSHGSYRFYTLQNRETPHGHSEMIYCIQLFTYEDGRQVLFSGSRDLTVREWDLSTGSVERVFRDVHRSSILSICAYGDYLASAGRDLKVCLWDLATGKAVHIIQQHTDSVLCVRFDSKRLVSCSKDHTIRLYRFKQNRQEGEPIFENGVILGMHRGAVNAIAFSGDYVISGSGDKSLCIWNANTCSLVYKFDSHHHRGIATVAAMDSWVVTGSSDMHLRAVNWHTRSGWGTAEEHCSPPVQDTNPRDGHRATCICERCGSVARHVDTQSRDSDVDSLSGPRHWDLVRTVAINANFVVSGSYDKSVKVWDRERGNLIADLGIRHEGRIFGVDLNSTKIVSCGEDRTICVWDLAYGIETSFIRS